MDEPTIYRAEALTIMAVLGDIRDTLWRILSVLEDDDGEEEADA